MKNNILKSVLKVLVSIVLVFAVGFLGVSTYFDLKDDRITKVERQIYDYERDEYVTTEVTRNGFGDIIEIYEYHTDEYLMVEGF